MSEKALARAQELRTLFEAKVRAELMAADGRVPGADTVPWGGDPLSSIVAVKGRPGPAEASGGAALSGPDGDALAKALEALGWQPAQAFATLSRPAGDMDDAASSERLRLQIEAVDPRVVVALDDVAAEDVARAFSLGGLVPGRPVTVSGRRFVAVGGFEAALTDERAKRAAWQHLKAAGPDAPVY